MLEILLGFGIIIFGIICILLYSFGKRILQLEIIIIEIVEELYKSAYISKLNIEHILNLTNIISNTNTIKENKDQTLN